MPLNVDEFTDQVASYVETHTNWDHLDKRQVAVETVRVLLSDIGAAQAYLDIIGIKVDLFGRE